ASGVLRELKHLERAGILTSRTVGRLKLYRLNQNSPIHAELAAIIRKTTGLADVIRAALAPLKGRIQLAYIYGSMAAGTAKAHSDVDVMVVGAASSMEVAAALAEAELSLGREVNPTVFAPAEYARKLKLGRGFPCTAHTGARIDLLGSTDEP
ncbi:MAG: nucleotidyltransferase domain-containing protein, partial [Anaerolineae bacterium]|nr:nucleotidyltransferase domain-containing protein [Anaerolineae bacterium]